MEHQDRVLEDFTPELRSEITSLKHRLLSAVTSGGPLVINYFIEVLQNHEYYEKYIQGFLNNHYKTLIQRVRRVMKIADKMRTNQMITDEMYEHINLTLTHQDKMRLLFDVLRCGGSQVQSYFYQVLLEHEPNLMKEIKEVRANKKPLRWKMSSTKHRDKIKEFTNDPSRNKVGSINFSRNEKYIIGSGSSGTQVYLGLKEDGTEVAIKRITKNLLNNKVFENELKHLQDLNLESRNIVRYVDFAEDMDFFYLALQLCECDLESYMDDFHNQEHKDGKDAALKKIVEDVLIGLRVLHRVEVIHRDIKPKNILIDTGNNARLADFGLSRKLKEGSDVCTTRAGTRGWEAVETMVPSGKSSYKNSSDVQVAGMLVHYILSDGKHPFDVNDSKDRETNIREGNYSFDDVTDIVAQDLIKRMINIDPAQRLTIEEALQHPYFWDDVRKKSVLNDLGGRDEVQKYELLGKLYNLFDNSKNSSQGEDPTAKLTIDKAFAQLKIPAEKRTDILSLVGEDLTKLYKLCNTAKKYCVEKQFSNWKTDLSQIWPDINQKIPEDLLGLLRVLRNKMVHANQVFYEKNMLNHFPDFFISLYGLAKDLSWVIEDAG